MKVFFVTIPQIGLSIVFYFINQEMVSLSYYNKKKNSDSNHDLRLCPIKILPLEQELKITLK